MRRSLWLLLPMVLLVAACDVGGGKPRSMGRPYEVTVVGRLPDSLAIALGQTVEGLPQAEPMFDVGRRPHLDPDTRLRRRTAALLNAFERRQQVEALRRHHNPRAAEAVKKMFGIEMLIPADMGSSMVRPGFIWLSNNAPRGMTNIAVMRGPADVALARHIKGETDAMHMQLTGPPRARGLWEMTGDAMGGPYVMRRVGDVTVIAFVYAPESKKRNLMRQLEAALYTIKQ